MNNRQLLKRIEKLETETKILRQAIFEIRTACYCVGLKDMESEDICSELPEIPEIEEVKEPIEQEDIT